jgi:fumarate reductase flavoprotein subunit
MSKFEKKIGRRDFLKGAGATAAGVAAVSVLGGMAFAAEDEVDAVTSASSVAGDQAAEETVLVSGGTKYTTYANTDQIGTLQPNAAQETADAVVVGTGIGGMMAAMILAEQAPDAKVVLLEKNDYCGGSTNMAECNAPQAGTTDPVAAYKSGYSQSASSSYIKDPILIAEMAMDKGKNSSWLFTKHNIGYSGMFYEGGNGKIPMEKLRAEIESDPTYANVDLRLSTRANALVVSDDGYEVTGIQVKNADGTYTTITCKAVVLATGGLSTNFALLRYYTGQDVMEKCHGWGAGQDGDGHLLVEQTAHGMCKGITVSSLFNNVKGFEYDSALGVAATMQPKNLYVNQYGQRFTSENISSTSSSGKMVELTGKVWSIMGQNLIKNFEDGGCTRKYSAFSDALAGTPCDLQSEFVKYADNENVVKADTIEELAEKIGVDVDNLVATVADYEADCAAGTGDSKFGKEATYMVSLGEGPYYGLRLSSGVLNTNGGIRIDKNANVCDPYFTPVKGLFAAGVCCTGWDGEVYGGGTCQTVGMWGGSKAARVIVEDYLGGTVADDWFGDEEYVSAGGGSAS